MTSSVWAQFHESDSSKVKGHRIGLQTGILLSNHNEVPFWMKNNSGGRFSDQEAMQSIRMSCIKGGLLMMHLFVLFGRWSFLVRLLAKVLLEE